MANASEVQVYIDKHHEQCVRALQLIAKLADTGSEEHKARFESRRLGDGTANGWRVAEAMREIAIDAVGNVNGN